MAQDDATRELIRGIMEGVGRRSLERLSIDELLDRGRGLRMAEDDTAREELIRQIEGVDSGSLADLPIDALRSMLRVQQREAETKRRLHAINQTARSSAPYSRGGSDSAMSSR